MKERNCLEKKYQKISESSRAYKEYQEDRREFSSLHTQEEYVFGIDVLKERKLLDFLHFAPERQLVVWERLNKRMRDSREQLQALCNDPNSRGYVVELIEEAMESPCFHQEVGDYVRKNKVDVDSFGTIFDPHILSSDAYLEVLQLHVDRFRKKADAFKALLPRLTQRFKRRVYAAQLPVDRKIVEQRLRSTEVFLVDALKVSLEEEGKMGAFNEDVGVVCIAEQVPVSQVERVFTHEMLHALSGRTIISEAIPFGEILDRVVVTQRIGLRFQPKPPIMFRGDSQPEENFRWLSEAVTEHLALKLTNPSEGDYEDERLLFRLLTTCGDTDIPNHLFYAAYFENYKPHSTRIPAWKTLSRAINEAYAPGFLVKLDRFVKEYEVGAAARRMRDSDGWRAIWIA